jgi:exodeoxyribonuclease VII large subunit
MKRRQLAGTAVRLSPAILARAQLLRRERLSTNLARLVTARAMQQRQFGRETARVARRLNAACLARIVARHAERYAQACRLFGTLRETASPEAILAKGYALVFDAAGRTVRSPAAVVAGDALTIRVAEGEIAAAVAGPPSLPRPRRAAKPAQPPAKASQGSLF